MERIFWSTEALPIVQADCWIEARPRKWPGGVSVHIWQLAGRFDPSKGSAESEIWRPARYQRPRAHCTCRMSYGPT